MSIEIATEEEMLRKFHALVKSYLDAKGYHPPHECPMKQRRQDPPMCPKCHDMVQEFDELDAKTKLELSERLAKYEKALRDLRGKQ